MLGLGARVCRIAAASTLLLAPLASLLPGPATARDEPVWEVKGKLLGKNDKRAEDVSGIACSSATGFPRNCLVIDDEGQFAQIVILEEGRLLAGDRITLIDNRLDRKPLELDGEGVAYDDGSFYVIGSHCHPRDAKRDLDPIRDASKIAASIEANSQIIRVRIDPSKIDAQGKLTGAADVKPSAELRKLLPADLVLAPFVDRRLDENGLTIEGLAVRDGRAFVGLRAPSLGGDHAAILSVALSALFEGATPDPKLHLLHLGPRRGIRDLAAAPTGFLVLAGPAAEEEGTYSIYRWDGAGRTELLAELPSRRLDGRLLKPEALLFLDQTARSQRVLVMADGAKDGAPRPIQIRRPADSH